MSSIVPGGRSSKKLPRIFGSRRDNGASTSSNNDNKKSTRLLGLLKRFSSGPSLPDETTKDVPASQSPTTSRPNMEGRKFMSDNAAFGEEREKAKQAMVPQTQRTTINITDSSHGRSNPGVDKMKPVPLGSVAEYRERARLNDEATRTNSGKLRAQTRRARNTFRGASNDHTKVNFMKNLVENTKKGVKKRGTVEDLEEPLSSTILKSLSRAILCDVEIMGKDEVPVEVPSFLLAAHSEVFEDLFYSKSSTKAEETPEAGKDEVTSEVVAGKDEGKYEETSEIVAEKGEGEIEETRVTLSELDEGDIQDGDEETSEGENESTSKYIVHKLELPFIDYDALDASIKFLATRSLPDFLENQANEFIIRSICQIHLFGRVFKINCLINYVCRMARRILNKIPKLVCAAFDECIMLEHLIPAKFKCSSTYDELKNYVLEYLRESPLTTLMAGGTVYLNDKSIEAIICDREMDVDEGTMFHILQSWVKQDKEENIETGKRLVSNIHLSFIKPDYLNSVVRSSGIVDSADVQAALKEIEDIIANQKPDEKEHMLVEGAGSDEINGIYVRMTEDIGLGEEEVMYVKEAPEDEYGPDYGLYLLHSTWSITSCIDYSNVLYSCEASEDSSSPRHQAPKSGWKAVGGSNPSPTCTWNPSKDKKAGAGGKGYLAPNLADSGTNNKIIGDVANGDHDEGRKRYTLRTMMNLPSDVNFED